ncbi:DUF6338 family protein [Micromonospora sp. NPDC048935]|uniref:DUF6338 family protein n=1 Tax=Micromonospora sp. NPDC048935 TaxID=3364262 RepID=UPI0037108142
MPTTVVSLLLAIVFALPGHIYHRITQRKRPERVETATQEILATIFAGIVIDFVAVALLGVVAQATSLAVPDFSRMLLGPGRYTSSHLPLVTAWSAALVGTAIGCAVVASLTPWDRALPKVLRQRRDDRLRRTQSQQSAWWLLFHEHRDADIHVGCTLDDGSYVAGRLHSYSRAPVESSDRELTLRGEILYRPAGEVDAAILHDVNAVSISARRLILMTVTYVVPSTAAPQSTP